MSPVQAAIRAVTFDAGQTLVELDSCLLVERLLERGERVERAAIERENLGAWRVYNQSKAAGEGGRVPWQRYMQALLARSGLRSNAVDPMVDWLWSEQPKRNLWRRPIAGMIELVRELRAAQVRVGIISNSEGRLAELIAELGWAEDFEVIVDSGRQTFEKPDPRMFQLASRELGVALEELVHIGDAPEADVRGALEAGARAILFGTAAASLPEGVLACNDAQATRAALRAWGLDLRGDL